MTFRARSFALTLCATLAAGAPLLSPRVASAQDDATIQMARERFQEGVKYYDAKQYTRARASFLQAYALKKHPAVLLNLAQSELRSGYEADAAKHFSQYLREAKEASAAERQEANKGLSAAKSSVAELAVTVDVDNAELYVDGNLEGRTPLPGPIYLKPGSHNLEARKDSQTATSAVTAIAGQSGSVSLSFTGGATAGPPGGALPPAAGGAPPPGPAGAAGAGAPPPSPGPDTGTDKPGFVEWAKGNPVAWVGGGLTVGGLAGGVGFALAAKQSYSDADTIRNKILAEAQSTGVSGGPCDLNQDPATKSYFGPACDRYQQRVDDGDSQKSMATVSFVISGVAVAGTVVYYFIDTGSNEAKIGKTTRPKQGFRAAVVPVVSPTEKGFSLVGHF